MIISTVTPYGVTRTHGVNANSSPPGQNRRHFADDIFKWIFVNEKFGIWNKFPLKFVPKGPVNNIPALGQIMAWRRPGDKPLSKPMVFSFLTHICVSRPQRVNCTLKFERQTRAHLSYVVNDIVVQRCQCYCCWRLPDHRKQYISSKGIDLDSLEHRRLGNNSVNLRRSSHISTCAPCSWFMGLCNFLV